MAIERSNRSRSVRGIGAVALALSAILLAACGAKTGLLVPTIPAQRTSGTCTCGSCRTSPWCPDQMGGVRCVAAVGADPAIDPCLQQCQTSPSVVAHPGLDRNGVTRNFYCANPTIADGGGTYIGVRGRRQAPDPCHFDIEAWNTFAATPSGANWGQHPATTEGTSWYRVNCFESLPDPDGGPGLCGRPDGGLTAWGARIACRKHGVLGQASYVTADYDASSRAGLQEAGVNMVAAHCNALSSDLLDDIDLSATGPFGSGGDDAGTRGAVLCFVEPSTVGSVDTTERQADPVFADAAVNYNSNPPNEDPGAAPHGYTFTVANGSTLTITQTSDDAQVEPPQTLSGTAAAALDPAPGTYFVLTDLAVQTTGTVSYDGGMDASANGNYTGSEIHLQNVWPGTIDRSTGTLTIPTATAPASIAYTQNGSTYNLASTPSSISNATWVETAGVPTVTLDADLVDNGRRYAVHLVLTANITRPTATIRWPSEPAGTTVQRECVTGQATLAATGYRTPSTATEMWTLAQPGTADESTGLGASIAWSSVPPTFTLPLYAPSSAPQWLGYSSVATPFEQADTRAVQVVDSQAPNPRDPEWQFDCSGTSLNPLTELCNPKHFNASDVCDTKPTFVVDRVDVYNGGAFVLSYQCGASVPSCTNPSYKYYVYWSALDGWSNRTDEWRTELTISEDFTLHVCKPVIIADAPDGTLAFYDFSTLATGAAGASPAGLSFTRASTATVQTGAATLVTGVANNTARVGNDGAGHWGLVIEESRTNLLPNSRNMAASGWASGLGTLTAAYAATAPDGATTVNRQQLAAGAYGNYWAPSISLGAHVDSAWIRRTTGSNGVNQAYDSTNASPGIVATLQPAGSAWSRMVLPRDASGTTLTYWVPSTADDESAVGGGVPGALDLLLDLQQVEAGGFATEAIVTTSGSATRAGERLYYPSGSAAVDSGRLSIAFTLQPRGARAAYTSAVRLWTVDASNYAEIQPSGIVKVVIGGSAFTTSTAMTWNALDTVDLWIAAGGTTRNTVVAYRVNGGGTTTLGTSGSPAGSISASGALDLLNDGTAAQVFTTYVHSIGFWRAGCQPRWAPAS